MEKVERAIRRSSTRCGRELVLLSRWARQGNQGMEGISQEAKLTMQQMHKQVSAMLPCPQLIEKETILIPPNNSNKFFKRLLYVPNFAPVTPKNCSHPPEPHLFVFDTQHCTWSFRSIARWSCEEIIGPCLRRPQAAAAPRNSNSPTFYLRIVKFNIFAPTTMHEFN